jgi:hypothetical protein
MMAGRDLWGGVHRFGTFRRGRRPAVDTSAAGI